MRNTTLMLLLLISSLLLTQCGRNQAGRYNPYNGSLVELLPKQFKEPLTRFSTPFVLTDTNTNAIGIRNETGAADAVQAKYVSKLTDMDPFTDTDGTETLDVTVLHALANFPTPEEANRSLQRAARERKLILNQKTKNGVVVGQMFEDSERNYRAWTNGTLLSIVVTPSYKIREDFETACPY